MSTTLTALFVCATTVVLVGCAGDGGPQKSEPTATIVITATAPATGIESVDAAIMAIQQGDAEALVAQMRFTRIACEATPQGLSIFPRCEGAPDGSLVEGFPIASCEGGYVLPDEAREFVLGLPEERPSPQAYAVYPMAGSRFGRSLYAEAEPEYAVVLQSLLADRAQGWALLVDGEGLVGVTVGCGESPHDYVSFWELPDPIIPPSAP